MINKPYGTTSQFVSVHDEPLLGDIDFPFPEGTHAIGRLDKHSEGLLLLTTDKRITSLLFQGKVPHTRTYLVQVRFEISAETVERLRNGVTITIQEGKEYTTPPCDVHLTQPPPGLFPLPFERIDYQPTSWLLISLTEGRFHQVRKMVKAVRHRCLRLIRVSIEDMQLGDLPPGGVKEFEQEEFFRLLKLESR